MSYEDIKKDNTPEAGNEFSEKIQYVDKKGMIHHFKTTEELSQFREEENENQN